MNTDKFIAKVTSELYFGSLPKWQKEPLMAIVAEGIRRNRSIHHMAYVLATAHHETARFKYTHEIGKGSGRDYGQNVLLIRGQYVKFYGRGPSQLTWLHNYAKMSVRLSVELDREIDLVSNPDLAAQPEYAAMIIWEGMISGLFTGKNLSDYLNPAVVDYKGARRIVNGTDKAKKIAKFAGVFESGLEISEYSTT